VNPVLKALENAPNYYVFSVRSLLADCVLCKIRCVETLGFVEVTLPTVEYCGMVAARDSIHHAPLETTSYLVPRIECDDNGGLPVVLVG
jgi:hypothetical protein